MDHRKSIRYAAGLAEFITVTRTGASISSIHILLPRDTPRAFFAETSKVLGLAKLLKKISILCMTNLNPGQFLRTGHYIRVREVSIISGNFLPYLRQLVLKDARPTVLRVELNPAGLSGNPAAYLNIEAETVIRCPSVRHFVLSCDGSPMLLSKLKISPTRFDLDRASSFETGRRREGALAELLNYIESAEFSQLLRTVTVSHIIRRYCYLIKEVHRFCREKGLSFGAAWRAGSYMEWLLTDGKASTVEQAIFEGTLSHSGDVGKYMSLRSGIAV